MRSVGAKSVRIMASSGEASISFCSRRQSRDTACHETKRQVRNQPH